MPPSRMQNTSLAMPLIEDLSRYGIEDCSYSPEAQKSNAYSTPILENLKTNCPPKSSIDALLIRVTRTCTDGFCDEPYNSEPQSSVAEDTRAANPLYKFPHHTMDKLGSRLTFVRGNPNGFRISPKIKHLELFSRLRIVNCFEAWRHRNCAEVWEFQLYPTFSRRALKVDLKCLAEELGETLTEEMKVPALKKLIVASKEYEEVFAKELLHRIVSERENEIKRQEREDELKREEREDELKRQERDELKRQEREDEIKRQEKEYELEKLKIEDSMMSNGLRRERNSQNEKEYKNTCQQARRVHIKEEDCVTNLVGLLPLEVANFIAREPEEKANDYEHIKGMLLKRFKLSPEAFKIKFKRHCKSAENTWRDFGFELANYFNEWISGLKIYDFDRLKQLVIVEQMKEQVSRDIQQHFIDDWSRIVTVDDLTEKLDDYMKTQGTI
ncbi:retrovirus-related Pol polyprotein from transposon opus [Trichonephila clavipes]|nr:retrovirus-related Pol polyprotein from transposon opus [Trichonephila clavipes]